MDLRINGNGAVYIYLSEILLARGQEIENLEYHIELGKSRIVAIHEENRIVFYIANEDLEQQQLEAWNRGKYVQRGFLAQYNVIAEEILQHVQCDDQLLDGIAFWMCAKLLDESGEWYLGEWQAGQAIFSMQNGVVVLPDHFIAPTASELECEIYKPIRIFLRGKIQQQLLATIEKGLSYKVLQKLEIKIAPTEGGHGKKSLILMITIKCEEPFEATLHDCLSKLFDRLPAASTGFLRQRVYLLPEDFLTTLAAPIAVFGQVCVRPR